MIGHRLGDVAVARALADASGWWSDADSPDPLDRADYMHNPAATAKCLRRRAASPWRLGQPRSIPSPKPDGRSRTIVSLDPLAEIYLRMCLDPVAADIDARLSKAVSGSRLELRGGGWRTAHWRAGQRHRRELLGALRTSGSFGTEAQLDVADHFNTISRPILARTLRTIARDPWCLEPLLHELDLLASLPGMSSGLPTGPEISAVLGTVALIPVDRRLGHSGVVYDRWVDDLTAFAEGETEGAAIIEMSADQLRLIGQALNPTKSRVVPLGAGGEPPSMSGDLTDAADGDPADALRVAIETGDYARVRYALGGLRAARDVRGVPILASEMAVLRLLPKQCAQYLQAVASQIDDWDFLLEELDAATTIENAAAQLHLLRLLPSRVVGGETVRVFFERGVALDRHRLAPVADHFLVTSSKAVRDRKPLEREMLEYAEQSSELNCRRALAGGFRQGGVGRRTRIGLEHLRRLDPDLSPTVDWVLAS